MGNGLCDLQDYTNWALGLVTQIVDDEFAGGLA